MKRWLVFYGLVEGITKLSKFQLLIFIASFLAFLNPFFNLKDAEGDDIPEIPYSSVSISGIHGTEGGQVFFDNLYVSIDGGPAVYVTSVLSPQAANGLWDTGYRFHIFTRNHTTYTLWASSCSFGGSCSELSEPYSFHTAFDPTICFDGYIPTANAGINKIVLVGSQTELDGSGSLDPFPRSDDGLLYHWRPIYSPFEDLNLVYSEQDPIASFIPETPGTYLFSLQVYDQLYGQPLNVSPFSYIKIFAVEDTEDPDLIVADAGPPVIQAQTGSFVVLNGSGSIFPQDAIVKWIELNPVGEKELRPLAELLGSWQCQGAQCVYGDYDEDGDVDGQDLFMIAENWGPVELTQPTPTLAFFTPKIPRPYLFLLSIQLDETSPPVYDTVLAAVHSDNAYQLITPPSRTEMCY